MEASCEGKWSSDGSETCARDQGLRSEPEIEPEASLTLALCLLSPACMTTRHLAASLDTHPNAIPPRSLATRPSSHAFKRLHAPCSPASLHPAPSDPCRPAPCSPTIPAALPLHPACTLLPSNPCCPMAMSLLLVPSPSTLGSRSQLVSNRPPVGCNKPIAGGLFSSSARFESAAGVACGRRSWSCDMCVENAKLLGVLKSDCRILPQPPLNRHDILVTVLWLPCRAEHPHPCLFHTSDAGFFPFT